MKVKNESVKDEKRKKYLAHYFAAVYDLKLTIKDCKKIGFII